MSRQGVALVEVLLALLVLEILVAVGHRAIGASAALLSEASRRGHALDVAVGLRDSLAWFGYGGDGVRNGPWGRLEWMGSGGIPVRVDIHLLDPGASVPHTRLSTWVPLATSGT